MQVGAFSTGLRLSLDIRDYPVYGGEIWVDSSGHGYKHKINVDTFKFTVEDGVQAFCPKSFGRVEYLHNLDESHTFTYGDEYTLVAWAKLRPINSGKNWRTLWRSAPRHHALIVHRENDAIGAYENDLDDVKKRNFIPFGDANAKNLGLVDKWAMWTVVGKDGKQTFYFDDAQGGYEIEFSVTGVSHQRMSWPGQPFGCESAFYTWDKAFSADEVSQFYKLTKYGYP